MHLFYLLNSAASEKVNKIKKICYLCYLFYFGGLRGEDLAEIFFYFEKIKK